MPDPTSEDKFEMETFFKGKTALKLADGKTIPIPKLNWGREGKVIRCLGQMMAQVPNLRKLASGDKVTGADLVAILPDVLTHAPEYLTEMTVHLSGLSTEQVNDLDTEDVINIVYPFFPRIAKLMSTGDLEKLTKESVPEKPAPQVESPTS